MKNTAVCYFNGKLVPLDEAVIPVDQMSQQTLYDTARTYRGKLLTIDNHIDRIFHGCNYFGFDIGMTREDFRKAVERTLEANWDEDFMNRNGDYIISPKIAGTPLVYIRVLPLTGNFKSRAKYYREGLNVVSASTQRHVPPQCVDPRVKCPRAWFEVAIHETKTMHPDCWPKPLMFDLEGNISELVGGNIFFIKNEALYTPARNMLLGCSRKIIIELAQENNIEIHEGDYKIYDLYNADEAFVSGTSFCLLPIASINGVEMGKTIPGPTTQRVLDLYSDKVGIDIAQQYFDWEKSDVKDAMAVT